MKTSIVVSSVCVLFLSLLCQSAGAQQEFWTRAQGEDWPVFLGPNTDSKSSETGVVKDWSNGNLKIKWKCETGDGYGIGSVAKGRFYHFGRLDGQAKLLCLKAESGEKLWEFAYDSKYRDMYGYDSGPRASPLIDGERVYIYGVEGMLHCLDAFSGDVIWKLDVNEKFGVIQNFFGVASTPVVHKNLLIVMVGGSPDESKKIPPGALNLVKPNKTGVVAFDKLTGEVKYQAVDDLASYCSLNLVEIQNQQVLLAWMRDALFGLEPSTGKVKFEFPWRSRKLESVNASTPIPIGDDLIFISECYEVGSALLKFDGQAVKSVWEDQGKRDKALEAHWNTPVVIGDYLYGCSGRHSGPAELRCIKWKTGEVVWKESGLARSSLTYVDGHFVVLGELGELILIKANPKKFDLVTKYTSGNRENSVKFKSPCWAAPIISHGLMYVRGKDQLVCFELIPESK